MASMILMNDFVRQWKDTGDAVLRAVRRVGESGQYILGLEVKRFEEELKRLWQKRFAVTVGNGTDALEICLRALGCGPGDRVLTTPLSAFSTTLAIMKVGATPVFGDVDSTGHLDLECCEEMLKYDSTIRFLLPVHLYGHAVNLIKLQHLKETFSLKVLEDCAQAVGASFGGQLVGSVGDMAATSFYPTKNLGAMGDGGAILTDDENLARLARQIANYGQSEKNVHEIMGLNSRLDEIQAAILCEAHLPFLEKWQATRRHIAARYCEEIGGDRVAPLPISENSQSAWHLFPLLVEAGQRDGFRLFLESQGVLSLTHYDKLIPEQLALKEYGHFEVPIDLIRGKDIARRVVTIPVHPYLTETEVGSVIDAIKAWQGIP